MTKIEDNSREWFAFWVYVVSYLWLGPALIGTIQLTFQNLTSSSLEKIGLTFLVGDINPFLSTLVFGNLLLYVILSLFLLVLLRSTLYHHFYELIHRPRFAIKGFLVGFGIILFLNLLGSLFAFLLQKQSIFPENQQLINQMFTQHFVATLFLTLIFAPFVEEIIFRFILFRLGYAFHLRPWLIILISTVGYAFIHLLVNESLIVIAPYLAIGFGLSLTYQRYQNF